MKASTSVVKKCGVEARGMGDRGPPRIEKEAFVLPSVPALQRLLVYPVRLVSLRGERAADALVGQLVILQNP